VPYKQTFWGTIYKAVGSFPTLSNANNFVNRVLESNSDAVDAVAAGARQDAWLEQRFGYPTGEKAIVLDDSGIPQMRSTYNVGVYISHDSQSPNGYTVCTAYPLNKNPGELRL